MAFYDDISEFYDSIFPISLDTVTFIESSIGNPPKAVLDVACGTGGHSIELGKRGYSMTAVDLDSKMIENLSTKLIDADSNIEFLQADMLHLEEKFAERSFDGVYCIGNSLVHLDNLNQIQSFFCNVRRLLVENGVFIFQVVNYDRIVSQDIQSLPTIVNDSVPLKFERYYSYERGINKIKFRTILAVKDKLVENEINLTPLLHDDAIALLKIAGFKEIIAYGDFKESSFDKDNSYLLIIEAR